MSLGKKDIILNISSKAHVSLLTSKHFLDSFIDIIKSQSKTKTVKLILFGSFQTKTTPTRLGRNPKTKEDFIIPQRSKLSLRTAQNIKNILN